MVVQVRLLYAPPWRITEVGHNGADLKSVVAKAPWVRILHPPPYARLTQLGECLPYKEKVIGSSPISRTIWGHSSVGRASALQAEGQEFDPL